LNLALTKDIRECAVDCSMTYILEILAI